ncbi:MAG: hypothetical protein GY951_13060 [Psychromonas sp.]|nr:hypothetical protein [Psychromonas sp.]
MLKDVIEFLEKQDPKKVVRYGFGEPDSYRGYYSDVAFKPAENVSFGEMLVHAKSALGATFTGYKGGEYTMHTHTDCWIAERGHTSDDMIGGRLMECWEITAK